MIITQRALWDRYKQQLCVCESIGLRLDTSRLNFAADFFERMSDPMRKAFDAMAALEKGVIANPDENRRVGHYWLRAPELAPQDELRDVIKSTGADIHRFAERVHSGELKPEKAAHFRNALVIGIGGSALGPQLVSDALTSAADKMRIFFVDNTDPDGIDRVLSQIGATLPETLTIVISKSGGTKETRNGMLEIEHAYKNTGLSFGKHAVAVTGKGSELDRYAQDGGWVHRFPMWDWVGGRTSEFSAVGLLPASLQGFDIDAMLAGARDTDVATRNTDVWQNPAALLAL